MAESGRRQDGGPAGRNIEFGRSVALLGKCFRYRGTVVLTLGLSTLSGCAGHDPAPVAAPSGTLLAPAPVFSLDTPVDRIAADPRGKAVLQRDLPGLMSSRSYILFDDMSLTQIASVSGGRLTKARLDLVEADLSQICHQPP
jgi:hypothetical protein